MKRDSYIFYRNWWEAFRSVPDEIRLEVYDSIMQYAFDNKLEGVSPVAKMVIDMAKPIIDKDRARYEAICERNKANGLKGGRPKTQDKPKINPENPVGSLGYVSETQKNPEKPYNDNDNDNDNDNSISELDPYRFDSFWDLYDKKVDRGKCETKWKKLSIRDRKAAIEYIPKYKESEPNKKFRKNPEAFLNNRAWENELIFREEEQGINTGKIQKEGFKW